MLKNYKELKDGSVCELETQTMISGDLDYMKKEKLQELREGLGDVERMLKAMIKSLENKHLNQGFLSGSNSANRHRITHFALARVKPES